MHTTVAPKDIKVRRGVLFVCFAANHSEVIIVPGPCGARQNPPTFWNSYTRTLILDTIMKLSGTIGMTQKTMTFDTHVCLTLLHTLNPQERWGTHKKRWPFQPHPFGDVIGLVRCSYEVNQQRFSNFAMQTRFWATMNFINLLPESKWRLGICAWTAARLLILGSRCRVLNHATAIDLFSDLNQELFLLGTPHQTLSIFRFHQEDTVLERKAFPEVAVWDT